MIKKLNVENLSFIIETLNETFKYPYLNKEIIDSILIKLFLNKNFVETNKESELKVDQETSITKNEVSQEQTKRRRQ
jgi:hypothetical protein